MFYSVSKAMRLKKNRKKKKTYTYRYFSIADDVDQDMIV